MLLTYQFVPPFCPRPECPMHYEGEHPEKWYRKDGHHETQCFGSVQRYLCKHCGHTFSDQSFSLDYYAKRLVDYEQLFRQLRSTAGIRDLARNLEISRGSVQNRLFRMARWSIAQHSLATETLQLGEDLVFDGFESYTRSKYFPHHLNILIGKQSQFFYAMDFTTLRRKGTMSASQRLYRLFLDQLCRPDPKGIEKSICRLAETIAALAIRGRRDPLYLYSDDHPAYPRGLYRNRSLSSLMAEGKVVHLHSKSTKEPGKGNAMFAVNYMDRQLRKDIVNYVRQTVNVAKNVNCLLERLCIYRMHHNFCKPYRENSPKSGITHGSLAGCDMQWMNNLLARRFVHRPFASLLPLGAGERAMWFRRYRTPLKRGGEYLPKYVAFS